jgi:glycosyltransferase involved in cell wall biosynthesis
MKFDTALREYVLDRITEIGTADLLVGIPAYNSEETIAGVMKAVYSGLERYYPDLRMVLFVSDGGSLDYTREVAQRTKSAKVPKIVAIYRGISGKGTALRAVFQAAERLEAKACVVFDSDLRSITPEWVPALVEPVLNHGHDFVSPYYVRHKYDATITNHIAYSLTRALYGKRVRQPIGGDFAFSRNLVEFFTHADVWDSDVAKFGVDIWATTVALNEGFKICEAYLGSKIHDPKDPAQHLGPMFRQVVGTLFGMMPRYESIWRRVRGSEPIPVMGTPLKEEPPPVTPSLDRLHSNFRVGFDHFGALWREILTPESYSALSELAKPKLPKGGLEPRLWAHIVYDFAYAYLRWSRDRYKLVEIMTPTYYGRVASFILETNDMTTAEADQVVERQAEIFEEEKAYFLERFEHWETLTGSA